MKLLQINTTLNFGSHGRVAEEIGIKVQDNSYESVIAFGRQSNESKSKSIKIGNDFDFLFHLILTRLFDLHGYGSRKATIKFIDICEAIQPNVIHLHNIHGYYLNIEILFKFLHSSNIPIVWTLHDCWPFTGHCAYFDSADCKKWQKGCNKCPLLKGYPSSWIVDNSKSNFVAKQKLFNGINNLVVVTPSKWLKEHVRKSFLSDYEIRVIHNGIDVNKFKQSDASDFMTKNGIFKKYVLGVASLWSNRKGLADFIKLRRILKKDLEIVLLGLDHYQRRNLPQGMTGIGRIESIEELAAIYSGASALVNPTYIDNFPSVNIEALACGTPVITYNTGGSPESVDENTGLVVEKGSISGLNEAIIKILSSSNMFQPEMCRHRAVFQFSAADRYKEYLLLYEEILKK